MKNIKAIGFLIIAILAGLGAAIYAARWASQKSLAATSKVVVAATDIEMGSKVKPAVLTVVSWPSSSVPAGAFVHIEDLQERVIKVNMLKGEPLIERKLTPKGTQSGLSAVINEGKRAMTVRVNDVIGVAGFALPGTFVDVMVNTQTDHDANHGNRRNNTNGGRDNHISKTVLERVLVLAVAQESTRDESRPKVVKAITLELSPNDAEKLDLARSVGTLSLVLRNQFDQQAVKTAGMTRRELLDLAEAPLAKVIKVNAVHKPKSPAQTNCVDVFINGSMDSQCF